MYHDPHFDGRDWIVLDALTGSVAGDGEEDYRFETEEQAERYAEILNCRAEVSW